MWKLVLIIIPIMIYASAALLSAPPSWGWAVDAATGLSLMVIGAGLVGLTGPAERDQKLEVVLFLSAYALRVLAVIAIYQFGLVKVLGDEDASLWVYGPRLAKRWNAMSPAGILGDASAFLEQRDHGGYFILLGGFFYWMEAASRLAAGFVNAWFGSLTVVFTYRLAVLLFGRAPALYAGVAACVFPSLIVWSAQTLKEPVVIFLEVLALYATLRMQRQMSVKYILVVCSCVLALMTMRFYAALIVAGAIVLGLISAGGLRSRLIAVGAAVVFVLVLSLSGFIDRYSQQFTTFDVDRIQAHRMAVSKGPGSGSAVVSQYDLKSPPQLIMAIGVGTAHLLMAPFPWQLGRASLRMALTLPEVIAWWWLLWFALLPGMRRAIREYPPGLNVVFIFCVTLGLLYAAMFANVGLVFRQRAQLLPYLLIFIGQGLSMRLERRRARAALSKRSGPETLSQPGVAVTQNLIGHKRQASAQRG